MRSNRIMNRIAANGYPDNFDEYILKLINANGIIFHNPKNPKKTINYSDQDKIKWFKDKIGNMSDYDALESLYKNSLLNDDIKANKVKSDIDRIFKDQFKSIVSKNAEDSQNNKLNIYYDNIRKPIEEILEENEIDTKIEQNKQDNSSNDRGRSTVKIRNINDKSTEKKLLNIIESYDESKSKQRALAQVLSSFASGIKDYNNLENFFKYFVSEHYSIDNIHTVFFLYSDKIKVSGNGSPYKEVFNALKSNVDLIKNGSFVKMLLTDLEKGIDVKYVVKYCKNDLEPKLRQTYHEALNNEKIMQFADKVFLSNLDVKHFNAVVNFIKNNKENDINKAINSICNPLYPLDEKGNIDVINEKNQTIHSEKSFQKKLNKTLDNLVPKNKKGEPITRGNGKFFTRENMSKLSPDELNYLKDNYSKIKKEVMEIIFDNKYNLTLQEMQNLVFLSNIGFTKDQMINYASQNFTQEQIDFLSKTKQEGKISSEGFNLLLNSNLSVQIMEELNYCLVGKTKDNDKSEPLSYDQVKSMVDLDYDSIHYIRLHAISQVKDTNRGVGIKDTDIINILTKNGFATSENNFANAVESYKKLQDNGEDLKKILKLTIIQNGKNKATRFCDVADFILNGGTADKLSNITTDNDFIFLFGNIIGYNEIDEIYKDFSEHEGSLLLFKFLIQNKLDENSDVYKYVINSSTELDYEQLSVVFELIEKYKKHWESDRDVIDVCVNNIKNYEALKGRITVETFLYCTKFISDKAMLETLIKNSDNLMGFRKKLKDMVDNGILSESDCNKIFENNTTLNLPDFFDSDSDSKKKTKKENVIIKKIKEFLNKFKSEDKKSLIYFKEQYPEDFKDFIENENNISWFSTCIVQLSSQEDKNGFVDLAVKPKNQDRLSQLFYKKQIYDDFDLEDLKDIVETEEDYTLEDINPLRLLIKLKKSDIGNVFGSNDSMKILKDIYNENDKHKDMFSNFKDDMEKIIKCMKCFYKIRNAISKAGIGDTEIEDVLKYQKSVLTQIENGGYNDDIYRRTFAKKRTKRLIQAKIKRLVRKA